MKTKWLFVMYLQVFTNNLFYDNNEIGKEKEENRRKIKEKDKKIKNKKNT